MVAPIVAALSPLLLDLAKWGFGTIASVVTAKGKQVVEEKLGVNLEDALGTEQGRIELKRLEIQHQEFLINAAQQSEARDFEAFKTEVEDRKSARQANVDIATSEHAPFSQRTLLPAMAYLVTCGFFGCLGCLFYLSASKINLDDNTRDILIYAFGVISTGWVTIMSYLFGSSANSRTNQDTINKLLKRQQGAEQ